MVTNKEGNTQNVELRPLIARLKEIERKCDSMGTRNEEFPLMKDRLRSIIARLEAGEEPSGEPLAFREMARELFPIAHLFESVGFIGIGKEIAHVERALQDFEPAPATHAEPGSAVGRSPTTSAAATPPPSAAQERDLTPADGEGEPSSDKVPKPVLVGFLILLISIAGAAAVVLKIGPFQPKPDPTPVPATPAPIPSPTPEPRPTPLRHDPNAPPSPRERFADAMAQARLSFAKGDIDETVKYLSIAGLIDRNDHSVPEVAERIVDLLLGQASSAAGASKWGEAAEKLAEARSIAKRFSLDTRKIDAEERRYAEMEQYRIVEPEDIRALRAAIGKQVEVTLENGTVLVGRIAALNSSDLVLDIDDDVGGGVVSFTDEIPLATVRSVKIWTN